MRPYFLYCLLIVSASLWSQELSYHNHQYRMNDKVLSRKALVEHYNKVPQALQHFKKGEQKQFLTWLLVTPGALLAGHEIGRWSGGGKFNWQRIGAGMGAVALGVYFSRGTQKEFQAALNTFNQHQKRQSNWQGVLQPHPNGFVLTFAF